MTDLQIALTGLIVSPIILTGMHLGYKMLLEWRKGNPAPTFTGAPADKKSRK